MSKIKLDDIKEQLTQSDWQVLSSEYKNLDTEMEFLCSEGHHVFAPWKKIRNNLSCPICEKNIYKNIETDAKPKKKGVKRYLALDQATEVTGWSIFDEKECISYGIFKTSSRDPVARNSQVKQWLVNMIINWQPDMIAIEGIQYQETSGGADEEKSHMGITVFQTLARLQGVLMDACYDFETPVEVCPTNTWRKYCGVKGRTRSDKKKSMQQIVKQEYDISVPNDIADAIGIGKYLVELGTKKVQVFDWE